MASETPFKISRPSTLARRSLISKSANSLLVLLHHVSAVVGRLSEPVDVLRPPGSVRRGRSHRRETVCLQRLEVAEGALLGNLEVRRNLGQGRLAAGLQEGKDSFTPGLHNSSLGVFQQRR